MTELEFMAIFALLVVLWTAFLFWIVHKLYD